MRLVIPALTFTLLACHSIVIDPTEGPLPYVREIDGDRVYTLLKPDAIPSIDEPRFVPASEASFMWPDEPVVGVVHNGVAKAYSTWHLDQHEIVNDVLGRDPVAVTW